MPRGCYLGPWKSSSSTPAPHGGAQGQEELFCGPKDADDENLDNRAALNRFRHEQEFEFQKNKTQLQSAFLQSIQIQPGIASMGDMPGNYEENVIQSGLESNYAHSDCGASIAMSETSSMWSARTENEGQDRNKSVTISQARFSGVSVFVQN